MKIANKRPLEMRSPVRVTANKYDLYYSKPLLVGTINRIGHQWVTEDGVKFNSSRAALDYLVKLIEARGGVTFPKIQIETTKPLIRGAMSVQEEKPIQKKTTHILRKRGPDSNQKEYKEFQEFLKWKKKQKEQSAEL